MIQRRHLAPLAAALLLLAACNKEEATPATEQTGVPEGRMAISIEDVNSATGSKVLVGGLRSYWKNDETVWINGVRNKVVVDATAAGNAAEPRTYLQDEVQNINNDEYYIATTKISPNLTDYTIPATGRTFWMAHTSSPMEYSEENGRAYLSIPLVAVAPRTATTLNFKNVTAMVNVAVHNGINSTFRISSVKVSTTANYQLRGTARVTVYPDGSVSVLPSESGVVANKTLEVTFDANGNEGLLAYGETKNVPVPILPLPAGIPLTIEVTGTYPYGQPLFTVGSVYSSPGAGSTATYTRSVTLTNGLARNSYVNANVQLKPSESYFSSPVLDNWVTFVYEGSGSFEKHCLWGTTTNEDRAGSFELTAAHLTKIMMPELSSSTASAAGSLLVWHQGEDRFKLLIFPHGTTLGQFPTAVRPNVNFAGYTIKDYANNGGMRGIPCVNGGTYLFLGNGSYVDYISLDLNAQGISNYVTLDVVPLGPMGFSDSEKGYDPQSHTQYSRIRTHTRKYECKYKNMTVTVEEKKVEVYPCDPVTGVIYGVDPPISTHREVRFLTTRQDNLNPSSRALYGLRTHN